MLKWILQVTNVANGAITLNSYEHAVSDDWFRESSPLATWMFLCLPIQFVDAIYSYNEQMYDLLPS